MKFFIKIIDWLNEYEYQLVWVLSRLYLALGFFLIIKYDTFIKELIGISSILLAFIITTTNNHTQNRNKLK